MPVICLWWLNINERRVSEDNRGKYHPAEKRAHPKESPRFRQSRKWNKREKRVSIIIIIIITLYSCFEKIKKEIYIYQYTSSYGLHAWSSFDCTSTYVYIYNIIYYGRNAYLRPTHCNHYTWTHEHLFTIDCGRSIIILNVRGIISIKRGIINC